MSIVKFQRNRVRRNYLGGKGIDLLQGSSHAEDSDRPEEWIASMITANNQGLVPIEGEGLSIIGVNQSFVDLIKEDPTKYLGEKHYEQYGLNLGFLMKLLDSSMRLHTQAHPTREFAKTYMDSEWGKFEAYYILSIRDAEEGYIRLGFQNAPSKKEWKDIIEKQDLARMNECFKEIPIKPGDVVYIPGGVPHAIGENVLMIEIMEPSDLVIRCEFEREGIVVPKDARYMGKNLTFCIDVFDYTEYSVEQVKDTFFLNPEVVVEEDHFIAKRLVPATIAPSFEVYSVKTKGEKELNLSDERFWVGVCVSGSIQLRTEDCVEVVKEGDSFFISSSVQQVIFESNDEDFSELCLVSNVV